MKYFIDILALVMDYFFQMSF